MRLKRCRLQCWFHAVGSKLALSPSLAANVHGLLLCWHLLMSSRQLKPIKINNVEDNDKCPNEFRQPDIS
jgi:hypothetical protein